MKTYKIHFIRNGITKGNLEGRYIGHTDELLDPLGVNQITELDNSMMYPYCDVVFSSPLQRCIQTSHIIYPDKEPIIMNDLIECNFGEFENKTAAELSNFDTFKNWLYGGSNTAPPFGESGVTFGKRVIKCFEDIVNGLITSGITDCAIVTHGGVVMTILSAYGVPEREMTKWRCNAGCGYTLMITPHIWSTMKKGEVISKVPYKNPGEDDDEDDDYTSPRTILDL